MERQVHFAVERLKMDLPFVNVLCAQISARRSAGPLGGQRVVDAVRGRGGNVPQPKASEECARVFAPPHRWACARSCLGRGRATGCRPPPTGWCGRTLRRTARQTAAAKGGQPDASGGGPHPHALRWSCTVLSAVYLHRSTVRWLVAWWAVRSVSPSRGCRAASRVSCRTRHRAPPPGRPSPADSRRTAGARSVI